MTDQPDTLAKVAGEMARVVETACRCSSFLDSKRDDMKQLISRYRALTSQANDDNSSPIDVSKDELLDILDEFITKYEDGFSCYEEPDEQAGYLGVAVDLNSETFDRACDILNKYRPRNGASNHPEKPDSSTIKDSLTVDLQHHNDEQVSLAMHLLQQVEDMGLTVEQVREALERHAHKVEQDAAFERFKSNVSGKQLENK